MNVNELAIYCRLNAMADILAAASLLRAARHLTAFTGAGISVESGIPAFRGPGGLWARHDPRTLELSYFRSHPRECWEVLRELFYDHLSQAQPNEAHRVLARWEARGLLKAVITQNIDNLHTRAGCRRVIEFHGHTRTLSCLACGKAVPAESADLTTLPPRCPCGGVLKPDLVFFGEDIPATARQTAEEEIQQTDVLLVIGSTGEVYPAASLPYRAAELGARIIEINPMPSAFTKAIQTLLLSMPAGEALTGLDRALEDGCSPCSQTPS
jgi:NAD-dependent deacetylase